MACRTCKFFEPQTTATGRIKRAAGRCRYPPPELPPLPMVADLEAIQRELNYRFAAWPDDNNGCPTYQERG